uniref:Uncharacterized protein n=1 Tax=Nelumbo nucifera TaxID=4432 RepID=A0A822Y618_NELNU|nr:TPA_asm: hypothetical protein HUJ06_030902 [Nelumbo nucifera]
MFVNEVASSKKQSFMPVSSPMKLNSKHDRHSGSSIINQNETLVIVGYLNCSVQVC